MGESRARGWNQAGITHAQKRGLPLSSPNLLTQMVAHRGAEAALPEPKLVVEPTSFDSSIRQ